MLPGDLSQQFNELLTRKSFPDEAKSTYLKWLRFYWDFCDKYHYNPYCPESLPRFLQKLVEKRQSDQQMKQAGHAVTMFYRMQYLPAPFSGAALAENSLQTAVHNESTHLAAAPAGTMATGGRPIKAANQGSSVSPHENDITARTDTQTGSSWVLVYETLNSEIKIRHYSPKTLKSYRSWTRHFQAFTKSKNYQSLT